MRKILLSLQLFFIFTLKAQTIFCPPGADWHFAYGGGGLWGPIYYNNEEIKYTHDTTVFGKPAHVLEHTLGFFYSECSPTVHRTYIHTSGDSVWMYNGYTMGSWQMLYNFSTPPGQSWQFNVLNFTDSTSQLWDVRVDSVSQSLINSNSLKTLHVTYSTTLNMGSTTTYTYNSAIFERIGDTSYLFNFFSNFHGACDGAWAAGLLCYTDSSFATYQQGWRACDYTYTSVDEISKQHKISVYPNPVNDKLNVLCDEKPAEFDVTDISGRSVKKWMQNQSAADLPNGIYLVKIKGPEGIVVRKITVQH